MKITEKRRYQIRLLLTILFLLIMGAGMYATLYFNSKSNSKAGIVEVENTFADVNGDGLIDFVVKGKVIFNMGDGEVENVNF